MTEEPICKEIGISLRPTSSGAIVFNVAELSLDEAAEAAQDLQVRFRACSWACA